MNCDYFTIWKVGPDGQKKQLGIVQGHGTTSQVSAYEFEDSSPAEGLNYYQISQTDFDGTTTLSEIAVVSFSRSGTITCWHHDAENILYLRRTTDDPALVTITDLAGRILSRAQINTRESEMPVEQKMKGQVVLIIVEDISGSIEVVKVHL